MKLAFKILPLLAMLPLTAKDLEISKFAGSDKSPCPAVIAAAPSGEVFVGVDLQGSLGRKTGLGKVIRLVDTDADGIADDITDYVKVDNPRGIISLGDKLIVLHTISKGGKYDSQQISEFTDKDDDGVADGPGRPLVKGIGNSKFLETRGADHCTNNIRLGIDGWIYISVGDFGYLDAEGTDGNTHTMSQGGIARVRPDGSGLETFVKGTRNVYDVAIDPFMNVISRENTNDGVGWWARSNHYIQSGDYGYPSLYTDFPEDMLPALGEYGSGSGVGSLYLQEPSWPAKYNNYALLADWRKNMIYIHEIYPLGATFSNKVRAFMKSSQVTDLDIDASGRMYVAAWNGAGYKGNKNRGFVQRVVPKGWTYQPFPKMESIEDSALIELIMSKSITQRTYASYELVNREAVGQVAKLNEIAKNQGASAESRVAAVYTISQIQGVDALPLLEGYASDAVLVEHAIRCMADRLEVAKEANVDLLIKALKHKNPRVQIAATVALGRVGDMKAFSPILANAYYDNTEESESLVLPAKEVGYISPDKVEWHSIPRPDLILPHISQRVLLSMNAESSIVNALSSSEPMVFQAALTVAKFMHSEAVVDALIARLNSSSEEDQSRVARVLMRLHQKQAPFDAKSWIGTRPSTAGPYNTPVDWQATEKISQTLKSYLESSADPTSLVKHLKRNMAYVEPYFSRPQVKVASKVKKVKRYIHRGYRSLFGQV